MSVGGENPARLMPETIGKYRVVEPIGRGGMGMIFKAHDPVLDRLVAVKVITPEVDVSDELRTRFFREAKACAKLNHPNIVTVHDMGEDAGRLFIVMELLQGEELRQVIRAKTPMTLEDKLALMREVCRGLSYAHQHGIVHRDMKPANIFVLRTGHPKIVDFGIAQLGTTDPGLTRTGLIMGTLQYISPEQVRGRVDHRSDMYSLGAVCYELLTGRPPLLGHDPMQLLEQLRSEDPPPPRQLDPAIPEDLEAVVQRAMRKNPSERFRDLEEMGAALEAVHDAMLDARNQALARVRRQREQIVVLQTALADRVGSPGEDAPLAVIAERHGLVAVLAVEREWAGRIGALEAKIARAELLAPAVAQARALLEAGRFEEAAQHFERVLAELPDHHFAREGLDRARTGGDRERQRQAAADLVAKARAALADRHYAICLEIVKGAFETPLADDVRAQLAALRETALASQEALRQARGAADEARARSAQRRADAQAEAAAQHAAEAWHEAEAVAAAAERAFQREAYEEARVGFTRAVEIYSRSLEVSRQGQGAERGAAHRAREAAALGRNQALALEATQYARESWDAAEARAGEAQSALAAQDAARAGRLYTDAASLYRRAEETARGARDRERKRAEAARERAGEARRRAESLDAAHRAASTWTEAVARSDEAEAAWVRKQYPRAAERFEAALALYHRAQSEVRDATRRQREEARARQQAMAERRLGAMGAEGPTQAAPEWNEAESRAAKAEEALAREAWPEALEAFEQATALYRSAEERARVAVRSRADGEKAVAATERARREAAEAGAARHAAEQWRDAEHAEARAIALLSRGEFSPARAAFEEATRRYDTAAQSARAAETEPARRPAATAEDDATVVFARPPKTVEGAVPAPDEAATVLHKAPPQGEPAAEAPGTRQVLVVGEPRPFDWTGLFRRRASVIAMAAVGAILAAVIVWRLSGPSTTQDRSVAVAKPATPAAVETAAPPPVATPAPPPPAREEPAKTAPPAASVKESVEDALRAAGLLRPPTSDGAGVVVDDVGPDGKVRLVGVLKDRAAKQVAVDLVRGVAGVTAVDMRRVTVQTGWSSK